ncbi:Uncharacterised protein [Bordetella ansorpii]|uniref:Uncharacterized protein n=1 Tax=Bordetella ansorpii TaxID=288768 RepID=A0A157RHR0_9BORD|nr:Uncharacterised protein [Bordetella ansorpii]
MNHPRLSGQPQQRDVAQVVHQLPVLRAVAQHQILRDELHVHHAAAVMFQVEQRGGIRMSRVDLAPHRQHLSAQLRRVARLHHDVGADALEHRAHGRIARRIARARQRLVFPGPGMLALVLLEGLDGHGQQPGVAVGPQPQVHFVQPAGRRHRRQPGGHAAAQLGVDLGRVLARIVEQEHQVQVRGVAQFLAAQLAVGDHGEARLRIGNPVDQRPQAPHRLGQQHVGQGGQLVGQAFHRQFAFQVLRQQLEAGLALHVAHQVHLAFDVGIAARQYAGVEVGRQLARQLREIQGLEQGAPIDQAVQQQRMLRQVLRGPGAGRHHAGHAGQGVGVFGQQRQIGAALRDGLDQVHQAHGGIARVGCLQRGLQGGGQQGVHAAAAAVGQAAHAMAGQQRLGAAHQFVGLRAEARADLGSQAAFRVVLRLVRGRCMARVLRRAAQSRFVQVAHAGQPEGVAEGGGDEAAVVLQGLLERLC